MRCCKMKITQPVYQRGLGIKKESHLLPKVGAAKLDLGKKIKMLLFCAPLLLTLSVWRMCGKPRLAFLLAI